MSDGQANPVIQEPLSNSNNIDLHPIVDKVDGSLISQQLEFMRSQIKQLESVVQKNLTSSSQQEDQRRIYIPAVNVSPDEESPDIVRQILDSSHCKQSKDNDVIDFYRNNYGNPSFISQGPLSWVTLLKKDIYLKAIFVSVKDKQGVLVDQNVNGTEREFATKFANEVDVGSKLIKSKSKADSNNKQNENIQGTASQNPYIVHFKNGKKDLIGSINKVLQNRRAIWRFFDEFFDSELYCSAPIFNRYELEGQLFNIIGPRGQPRSILNLKKKAELATVGSMMLIARLVSISIYNGGYKYNPKTSTVSEAFIYDNQLSKDVIEVVKMCVKELEIFRETSIHIFQFQLLFKIYTIIAPENYGILNCPSSSVLSGILDSAISNGLNRDPEIVGSTHSLPNLMRRIWMFLLNCDFQQVMLVGSPPIIGTKFYDTKLPKLNNIENLLEYKIDESFMKTKEIVDISQNLLDVILDIREPPKTEIVKERMKPLERYVFGKLCFHLLTNLPSDTVIQRFEKQLYFENLINAVLLLEIVYHHLFLFHNERKESTQSFYYLTLLLKLGKLLYQVSTLVNPSLNPDLSMQQQFGRSFVVVQKCQLASHRVCSILFSVLARIKGMKIFSDDLDDELVSILNRIIIIAKRICIQCSASSGYMSDIYYQSWAISKIHSFITTELLYIPLEKNDEFRYSSENHESFLNTLSNLKEHDQIFSSYSIDQFKLILNTLIDYNESFVSLDNNFVNSKNSTLFQQVPVRFGKFYKKRRPTVDHSFPPIPTASPIINTTLNQVYQDISQDLMELTSFDFAENDKIWMDQYLSNAFINKKTTDGNLDFVESLSSGSNRSPNEIAVSDALQNNELYQNFTWDQELFPELKSSKS